MALIKKTVTVSVHRTFEIEIDEELLTPEGLEEFSDAFFSVDTPEEIYKHLAWNIVHNIQDDKDFVEGIGFVARADSINSLDENLSGKFLEVDSSWTDYEVS